MHLKDKLTTEIIPIPKTSNFLVPKEEQEEAFTATVGKPTYFCVGIVDMVNSTKIVARLAPNKSSRFYEIFLNIMAKVVRQYNGMVLKTMGDSLLFYFPDTSFSERKFGFLSCLECGLEMINTHEKLKKLLEKENLPSIDFRISFDYGNVTMMRNIDWVVDLVGPTINTCAKINRMCPVNGMVVGSDLYEKTKNFREYHFKHCGGFSADLKHPYPVFKVFRKD
jgi:class 3 adenylate cyclase